MPTYAGITSRTSRVLHVVPDVTSAAKVTVRTAACGRDVTVRWYEIGPVHEVCQACRRAMRWPALP
jgi:hypothetical protein